jgi:hypothetical protein
MRQTDKYGRYYWCVGVPESICPDKQIYLHADSCTIMPNGALSFDRKRGKYLQTNLALAPEQWYYVFAASVIDGAAVAIDHWKGEVAEE